MTQDRFAAFVSAEHKKYAKIIKDSGIRAD